MCFDPYQEHCDHEFNARYDRWDGWGDPELVDDSDYFRNTPPDVDAVTVPMEPPALPPSDDESLPF